MELHEALSQISEIRERMARSETFRGYPSITVGFSGVLGILAAAIQSWWVPMPESELGRYLGLWLSVASVSLIATGAELYWRARSAGPGLSRHMTLLAVEQFLPTPIRKRDIRCSNRAFLVTGPPHDLLFFCPCTLHYKVFDEATSNVRILARSIVGDVHLNSGHIANRPTFSLPKHD